MAISVQIQSVHSRPMAAVRRDVVPSAISAAWREALDQVWTFLRTQPGLRTDGHNIFLYQHATEPGAPMQCDFGVEVTRPFERVGEVFATETPEGEAAVAVHYGPYTGLREAHAAVHQWMAASGRQSAGQSWEIYDDPTPDPADTRTTIVYLLK